MNFKFTFIGVVLPERAQLSFGFEVKLNFIEGGTGEFKCSIVNNQLLAIFELHHEEDVMTLRNIAHNIILSNLSLIGFYSGIFYDVKIDRIYNDDLTTNYVYGVANTDIQNFWGELDVSEMISRFRPKTAGHPGVLLNRALNDFMSALKNIDDAAFFCYRAIESLRNHNSLLQNCLDKSDSAQWLSFREKTNCSREEIDEVKIYADDLRHGKPVAVTAEEVKHILITTWEIARKYFEKI